MNADRKFTTTVNSDPLGLLTSEVVDAALEIVWLRELLDEAEPIMQLFLAIWNKSGMGASALSERTRVWLSAASLLGRTETPE